VTPQASSLETSGETRLATTGDDQPPGAASIIEMTNAFCSSQILFASSDVGIYAFLSDSPDSTAEQVVAACDLEPRAGRLLLNACVAIGLLTKQAEGYRNSELAERFLVPGSPSDLSAAIRYNRDVYQAWGRLPDFIRDGKPAERPEAHLGEDPGRTRDFVLAMHGRALGMGREVVSRLGLQRRRRLLDLGGGGGTYSALIARRHPQISCTLIDLPAVLAVAEELLAEQGVRDRVETVPGDLHTIALPRGHDAAILFGVLHQEPADAIAELLERTYDALEPGGVLYVMDMMTDATHAAPEFSALFAVNMALTTHHGWVFSDRELRGWLTAAGFRDVAISPLEPPMPHWLAEAHKP
jgi:ubiquinone/menaquinone biosynthesis C-methylase UbiE